MTRWLCGVVAAVGLGCAAAPPAMAPPPARPSPAAPVPPVAPDHEPRTPVSYLPRDASLVIGLDLARIRASALWRSLEGPVMAMFGGALPGIIEQTRAAWIATGGEPARLDDIVVLLDGLPRAIIEDLVRAGGATIGADGDLAVYRGRATTCAWWLGPDRVVAAMGERCVERLRALQRDRAGALGAPAMRDAIAQVDQRAAAWAAAVPVGTPYANPLRWARPPLELWASLDLGIDLRFTSGARFADEVAATVVHDELAVGLAALKVGDDAALLTDAVIERDGVVVNLTQLMSVAALEAVIAEVAAAP